VGKKVVKGKASCAWIFGVRLMLVTATVEDGADFFNKALGWSPSPYSEKLSHKTHQHPTLSALQCK
jgi:hypothetical protein